MAYVTNAQLIEAMGGDGIVAKYTDDTGSTPTADTITEMIARADGMMDSYIAMRYATPVDTSTYPKTAAVLRACSIALAAFNIQAIRDMVAPDIKARRETWLEWLKGLAKGEIEIPAGTELPGPTSVTDSVFVSETRRGGRDNLARI